MTKLAVLVSGTGSIFEAILKSGIEVALVVADRPCRGLEIAEIAGVPTKLVQRTSFGQNFDRHAYSKEIVSVLEAHNIELIAMAGFMTILAEPVFERYEGKILNTHPSLLPAFKGENAVRDALADRAKVTGCTIHIATISLDDGPILAQAAVPVEPGDTVSTLQERIKLVERRLYPETIRQLLAS